MTAEDKEKIVSGTEQKQARSTPNILMREAEALGIANGFKTVYGKGASVLISSGLCKSYGKQINKQPDNKKNAIETICCFTGHRPEAFPWKDDRNSDGFKALYSCLEKEIDIAIELGYTTFIAGNALGVDSWAAEIVAAKKRESASIHPIIAKPFEKHNTDVSETDREMLCKIHEAANEIVVTSQGEDMRSAYTIRDKFMVDNSSMIIAVFDERSEKHGGTEKTLAYARQKGLKIKQILWCDFV